MPESDLTRELRQKGREKGLCLMVQNSWNGTVVNFDPITITAPRQEFSSYFFRHSTWSPDGRKLVGWYSGLSSGAQTGPEAEAIPRRPDGIVIVDTNGKELWHRPGFLDVNAIALSHRGDAIAFQGREGLFLLSIPVNSIEVLDGAAGEGHSRSATIGWSPDSSRIVYERDGKILIYDLLKRDTRQIAEGLQPTWSPDGRWIAYLSKGKDATLVSPLGVESKRIIAGKRLADPLRWSPDSEYLLYTEPDGANVLYRFLELRDRLIIYRVRDGSELAIIAGLPLGVGWRYQWVIREPPKH